MTNITDPRQAFWECALSATWRLKQGFADSDKEAAMINQIVWWNAVMYLDTVSR